MGCPAEVEIGDNLVFSVTTHAADTGAVTDADDVPSYRVYEEETGTAILTGSMAKLDDGNTTGFYTELIPCSGAAGFDSGKTYTVYVEATVGTVKGAISYGFKAYERRRSNVASLSGEVGGMVNLINTFGGTGFGFTNCTMPTVTTVTGGATSGELAGMDSRVVLLAAEVAKVPKSDGAVTWNTTARATIEAEVTDALNAYDPPTNAEMVDRTILAASYATSGELAGADSRVVILASEVAKIPKSDGAVTWNNTALASIQAEATDALNAYDPPTDAEMIARTIVSASYATSGELAGMDSRVVLLASEVAKVPKSDGAVTWNNTALASIQAEATDALNAYDPPTDAEMIARTIVAATYATSGELAGMDSRVASLATDMAKIPKSDGAVTWNDTAKATIQAEVTDALNAYDPPTNAEMVDRTILAASYATSGELAGMTTEIGIVRTTTNKLDTTVEVDGGVYRFTTNALELAPGSDTTDIKAVTDKLGTMLVIDGAVYQFTANALELSPGASTPASIADAVLEELLADHKSVSGSLAKALHEINQNINPTKIVIDRIAKTVSVYDTNGSTLLFTLTMGTVGSVDTIERS